jgi:hypothetical protein
MYLNLKGNILMKFYEEDDAEWPTRLIGHDTLRHYQK